MLQFVWSRSLLDVDVAVLMVTEEQFQLLLRRLFAFGAPKATLTQQRGLVSLGPRGLSDCQEPRKLSFCLSAISGPHYSDSTAVLPAQLQAKGTMGHC